MDREVIALCLQYPDWRALLVRYWGILIRFINLNAIIQRLSKERGTFFIEKNFELVIFCQESILCHAEHHISLAGSCVSKHSSAVRNEPTVGDGGVDSFNRQTYHLLNLRD